MADGDLKMLKVGKHYKNALGELKFITKKVEFPDLPDYYVSDENDVYYADGSHVAVHLKNLVVETGDSIKMKLEVGKTYLAKDGDLVTIVRNDFCEYYPFVGDNGSIYEADGRYSTHYKSSRDLIKEYVKPLSSENAPEYFFAIQFVSDNISDIMEINKMLAEKGYEAEIFVTEAKNFS